MVILGIVVLLQYEKEDDNPDGFWRAFAPNFYATLGGVGLAAAVGVPATIMANSLWSQHIADEAARARRQDGIRILQALRNEVDLIRSSSIYLPAQLSQGLGATSKLNPLQVQAMRLTATTWEEADQRDYINAVGEYALDQMLTSLYSRVGQVNDAVKHFTDMIQQGRANDLKGLLPWLTFVCSTVGETATAALTQIDAALQRLQQG